MTDPFRLPIFDTKAEALQKSAMKSAGVTRAALVLLSSPPSCHGTALRAL